MRYDLAKLNKFELYLFIALCYCIKFKCCALSRLRFLPMLNRRKVRRFKYPERRRAVLLRYRWGRFFDLADDHTMETQP